MFKRKNRQGANRNIRKREESSDEEPQITNNPNSIPVAAASDEKTNKNKVTFISYFVM